jgi:hypothetical protein
MKVSREIFIYDTFHGPSENIVYEIELTSERGIIAIKRLHWDEGTDCIYIPIKDGNAVSDILSKVLKAYKENIDEDQ